MSARTYLALTMKREEQRDIRLLMAHPEGREIVRAWGCETDYRIAGWNPSDAPYIDGEGAR